MNRPILSLVSALVLLPQFAQAEPILFVGVEDNQIVAGKLGEPSVKLTNDPARKLLPVRSKDGTQIAYVQDDPDESAIAVLVVVDADGRFRASWPVGHVESGEIRSGMRFVDEVEWIDANRIAVSGSINPSTRDCEIITVSDGSTTGFGDDGAGATFSPDGKHVAYLTGAAHFAGGKTPMLTIDESPAAAFPADIEQTGRPVWSDDGRSVALAARRAGDPIWMIANADVEHGAAQSKPRALPFPGKAAVYWSGSLLHVQNGARETYAWRSGAWARVERDSVPVDSLDEGVALQGQLRAERLADYWCARRAMASLVSGISIIPGRPSGLGGL